jgi:Ca-activated chloride channel homolog
VKPLLLFFMLFLAAGTSVGPGLPQQEVAAPVLSIKTELVTLPVTVVDPHGGFVTGLRREDFTVYDEGEVQPIEFFTSDDRPATIGLVIDSSGSMRERRQDVTAAATAFAGLSHPLDEFFTVNFNEKVWLGLPHPLAFTEDAAQLRAVLAAAPASGMTALHDAVDRALDHLTRGTRERRALIVVSDGGDNASAHTFESVLQHARIADATIYTVTLADPDDREAKPRLMKSLARETGGGTFSPRRADDVRKAFEQIARDIRSGYTIGFSTGDTAIGFHLVRVVADAGDRRALIARTRAGYYAGPPGSIAK